MTQVHEFDCTGCGLCVEACPAKTKALTMEPLSAQLDEQTVFDYGMIKNSAQTNMSEASSYLNASLMICFLLTGIIPAYFIARAKIIYRPLLKEVLTKFAVISLSLLGLLIIAFFYYQDYAAVGRNNKFLQKYKKNQKKRFYGWILFAGRT